MANFVKAATVEEIPLGEMRSFKVGYDNILICHTESGFYAIANECTHDSAPMTDGKLKGNVVICRRHGAKFDITNGAVLAPPAVAPLDSYPVKIEDNDILVELPE